MEGNPSTRPERHPYRRLNALVATGLSAAALTACSHEAPANHTATAQCNERVVQTNFSRDGIATFTVHGEQKGEVATVTIRRHDDEVRAKVTGDVTGPPQQLGADGYTRPVPIGDGSELSAFGAGGVWLVDANEDGTVTIRGSCEGL